MSFKRAAPYILRDCLNRNSEEVIATNGSSAVKALKKPIYSTETANSLEAYI